MLALPYSRASMGWVVRVETIYGLIAAAKAPDMLMSGLIPRIELWETRYTRNNYHYYRSLARQFALIRTNENRVHRV